MNRYEYLDVLRFPLACSVVMLHLNGNYTNWSIYDIDIFLKLSTYDYITLFTNILGQIAVPTFFFISGFLFLSNKEFNINIYKYKLIKRTKSLLFPYLVWNTITLSVFFLQKIGGVINGNNIDGIQCFLQWSNIIKYYMGDLSSLPGTPIDIPLWFIRDLYIMFLISPVTVFLLKRLKHHYILVLFVLYQIIPVVPCFQIQTIAFFTLGIYIRFFSSNYITYINKYRTIIIFITTISFILRFIYGYSWLMPIFIIFCFLLVLYIAEHIQNNNIGRWLIKMKDYSFFIFASHYIIIRVFYGLFYSPYLKQNELIYCISYFFNIFITVFLCIQIYKIIKRISPLILSAINGTR